MEWQYELIERLAAKPCTGYGRADSLATEPSALAGLALAGAKRWDASRLVADWLAEIQSEDGSVGVRATEPQPGWPTSLAMLTWIAHCRHHTSRPYQTQIDKAAQWILSHRGLPLPKSVESGHDSTLDAWSWVDETHAWVEPTAFHVLALKAGGFGQHARTRSAIAMLLDRQLPNGGWNYGNTIVLGNVLRPHLQPTGLALLALTGEPTAAQRLHKSQAYLQTELVATSPVSSLCWGLIASTAQQTIPPLTERWLEGAYNRVQRTDALVHKFALIALALQLDKSPIVELPASCDFVERSPALPVAVSST